MGFRVPTREVRVYWQSISLTVAFFVELFRLVIFLISDPSKFKFADIENEISDTSDSSGYGNDTNTE